MTNRICFFIPVDGYIEGHGYRVSIVTENEAGHAPTGTWPYTGAPGETMPWFWGHDYDKACELALRANTDRLNLTERDILQIMTSSMKKTPARGRRAEHARGVRIDRAISKPEAKLVRELIDKIKEG